MPRISNVLQRASHPHPAGSSGAALPTVTTANNSAASSCGPRTAGSEAAAVTEDSEGTEATASALKRALQTRGASRGALAPLDTASEVDAMVGGLPAPGRTVERVRSRSGLSGRLVLPSRAEAAATTHPDFDLLIAVHGVARNLSSLQRGLAHPKVGSLPILLPRFTRKRHTGYQRLAPNHRGVRADAALLDLIEVASRHLSNGGASPLRLALFGFSGGAQFAHRFALLHPERVARLSLASAGFYTMPRFERAYPYGIAGGEILGGALSRNQLERFATIPKQVLVGELDTERDRHLRASRRLDREQGTDRVQRARRYVLALRALEIRLHGMPHSSFELLPRSGHSFSECVTKGSLANRLARFLRTEPAAGGES